MSPPATTGGSGPPPGDAEPPPPATPKPKSRTRQILQIVFSLVLVVAVGWYIKSQVADFSDVWEEMKDMSGLELALLGVAAIWNLATYWIIAVTAAPGLSYPQAIVLTESTTAVANTVPAGGAVAVGVTYAMLSSWGFSRSRATVYVVVTGIWNNFVKLGMPILALALLALTGNAGGGRIIAALLGMGALVGAVVVFALILRSEDFARRTGIAFGRMASALRRPFGRGQVTGWDIAVVKFRSRVIGLVRRRWVWLTVSTIVSHVSLYLVLLIALRQIGVPEDDVSWAEVLAVFSFARLLTAIPLTPGGVGVVELALISGLTAADGDHAKVVAAVLVYRLLTFVLPIPIGLVTYVFWRRNRSWRDAAPPLAPEFAQTS